MNKQIYILSDQRPGHTNQSRGLLLPFSRQGATVGTIDLPTPRHALKHLCLALARALHWSPAILRRIYQLYYRTPLPELPSADLLVSTGGDSLVANIILGWLLHVPNVFVGKRTTHTDNGIHLLVTTTGQSVPGKVVVTDFAPVNVEPLPPPPRDATHPRIAVLLGGNSNEYQYMEEDFIHLASSLNTLCQRSGARLLLTTSRRTSAHGDQTLKEKIEPRFLETVTWYSNNPTPTATDYCNRADIILCSEDSGTMLTESITHGKPVVSFSPEYKKIPPFYDDFLGKMKKHNVIEMKIPELSTLAIQNIPNAIRPDIGLTTNAISHLLNGPHEHLS